MTHTKSYVPKDVTQINLSERPDVQYWLKELNVKESDLRAAVTAVGRGSAKVREQLHAQANVILSDKAGKSGTSGGKVKSAMPGAGSAKHTPST